MPGLTLALGAAVAALAVANVVLVVVYTRRARRLAKLRMDFVASVSHELRTPLAVICSAAENLADGVVDTGASVKEYGQLIRGEGRRLGAMVEKILQFSSVSTSRRAEPRPLEIGPVVAAILAEAETAIETAGFTVETSVDPDMPAALADERGLRECLHNLIGNALKYGGEARWIGVRAGVVTEAKGPEIQVTIADRGMGIKAADLDQIFQPFYRGLEAQAKALHGTGLGLSMTKEIIEAMGGKITVESEPERGSAFTLHLPIAWP